MKNTKNIKSGDYCQNIQIDNLNIIFRDHMPSTEEVEVILSGEKIPQISKYSFIKNLSHDLDAILLPAIRDHRHVPEGTLSEIYDLVLHAKLKNANIGAIELRKIINSNLRYSFLKTLPVADLKIVVGDDFERITFITKKDELIINEPVLLWDCCCSTKPVNECKIHSSDNGKDITRAFNNGLVEIHIHGMVIFWKCEDELFPPSIDTFFLLESLVKQNILNCNHKRILDIGCGTGVIGIFLALNNPNITEVDFFDWLVTPAFFSSLNYTKNVPESGYATPDFSWGMHNLWLKEGKNKKYDICICNPPYLPLVTGYDKLGINSTVAGTDLIEFSVSNCFKFTEEMYISVSSLAMPELQSACRKLKNLSGMDIEEISPARLVPFRNPYAFRLDGYVDELIKKRGLKISENSYHRYWHHIHIFRLFN